MAKAKDSATSSVNVRKKSSARKVAPQEFGINQGNLNQTLRTVAFWVIGILIAVWVFQENRQFVFLLLLAWLTAIAMNPGILWLMRKGLKRGVATGVVLLGLILLLIGFVGLFGGLLFTQAASLVGAIPNLLSNVVNWLNQTFELTLSTAEIQNSLNLNPEQVANWASNFAGGVVGLVSTIIGAIFQLMTLLLFAFYFAADAERVRRTVGGWLSPNAQEVFVTSWDIVVAKTGGFVASKLFLASLSALAHGIFYAAIGVPYWLPMAIITGITSQFIPVIGTYLGILIPTLFTLFNEPLSALWIIIFASIYQQFENYLLTPRISKIMMNIHPAIAFAAVIVFANLFGAAGALIAIPIAAAIVAVSETYGKRYELIPKLNGESN
jgi:predicted PurR-regulated permease PerM